VIRVVDITSNRDLDREPIQEPALSRHTWLDQWLAVRWRALGTWVVLAICTGLFLQHCFDRWIGEAIRVVVLKFSSLGLALPVPFLELCNIFALLSWYQPVILRLRAIRCVLWVVSYVLLGLFVAYFFPDLFYRYRFSEAAVIAQLCGIPGLVVIGARTRPWMTLAGGVISLLALLAQPLGILFWSWFAWVLFVVNLPYAVVMIYGTRRFKRRGGGSTEGPLF
jgi:hypothetical protein